MSNTNQSKIFKNECTVINLYYEYPNYTGEEKWAIITGLTETEFLSKYPKEAEKYTPFLLLTLEHGEIIRKFNRNEDKFKKRSKNNEDLFGYDESLIEYFHPEVATPDYWKEKMVQDEREYIYKILHEAFKTLSSTQRKRLYENIVLKKSSRTIALEEGINYSSVDKSIESATKKIEKYFFKKGVHLKGSIPNK